MKFNKWTMGLAAVGVVSLASAARADEKLSQIQTALSNTTLSGYVDTSAQWNLGSQNGLYGILGNTPGYSYGGINKADGFNLNAIDIALDKPLDESPWAAGYHVEVMAGPDSPTKFALGKIGPISTSPIVGQISSPLVGIRQAYVTLRMPVANSGIDWKVGVFDTIIGYESSSDPLNPNYTRSYGYSIEPTTHTGILATYKVNDMLSISAGVANSSNIGTLVQPINGRSSLESQKTYMGSIAFTAPDSAGFMKGATLNLGVINSIDSNVVGNAAILGFGLGGLGLNTFGTTSLYAGLTVPTPMTALKVGASFDFLDIHNARAVAVGGVPKNASDDSSWDVALYANFQANDKLSFNLRAEYLDDSASVIYGNANAFGGATTGNAAEEVTATVQYQLWANVLSRVELRWDHVEHTNVFDSRNNTGGLLTPTKDNAFMLALNLIYQF
jgi:hypothetical protein